MKITGVRVHVQSPPQGKVLAFVDIRLDDVLVITRLRIIDGRNGPFVAMPSWKDKETGAWADFVIPQDDELRRHVQDTVLAAYREAAK